MVCLQLRRPYISKWWSGYDNDDDDDDDDDDAAAADDDDDGDGESDGY